MLYDVLRVIFVSVRPQLCTAEREAGLGPVGRFLGSSLPDLNPDFSALDTLKSLGSAPALFILKMVSTVLSSSVFSSAPARFSWEFTR